MNAFRQIYIPKVAAALGRPLTDTEKVQVLDLYIAGWHPGRVADLLRAPPAVIYLQWYAEDGELAEEVEWCVDRIHETDIEYRLAEPQEK